MLRKVLVIYSFECVESREVEINLFSIKRKDLYHLFILKNTPYNIKAIFMFLSDYLFIYAIIATTIFGRTLILFITDAFSGSVNTNKAIITNTNDTSTNKKAIR